MQKLLYIQKLKKNLKKELLNSLRTEHFKLCQNLKKCVKLYFIKSREKSE